MANFIQCSSVSVGHRWVVIAAQRVSTTSDFVHLRALLTQAVKQQVKDVMEENPIDLVEMLNTTEEVLAKYD